jgi:hypothetical protein
LTLQIRRTVNRHFFVAQGPDYAARQHCFDKEIFVEDHMLAFIRAERSKYSSGLAKIFPPPWQRDRFHINDSPDLLGKAGRAMESEN